MPEKLGDFPELPEGYYWFLEEFRPIADLGKIQIRKARRFRRDEVVWDQFIRVAVKHPNEARVLREDAARLVRGFSSGRTAA